MPHDVIFDLDGTLVDTSGDIIDCLNIAFTKVFGGSFVGQISQSAIGPPLAEMIDSLAPGIADDERAAVIHAFRDCYDNNEYLKTRAYAGVPNILYRLEHAGARIFIATNKPQLPTLRMLRLFPKSCFLDVITPDSGEGVFLSKSEMLSYLKARWNLGESYYVGDSPQDIIAARENGMKSIAVLYGYGIRDDLAAQNPHYTAAHADEIASIILQGGKSCEF